VSAVTIDLDDDALDALIHRAEEAREHKLALSPEDLGGCAAEAAGRRR